MFNTGLELVTGLTDIPLFLECLFIARVAHKAKGDSQIKRGWIELGLTVSVTVLIGVVLHCVVIDNGLLRFLWPAEYILMMDSVRRFWLQMISVTKGAETSKKWKGAINVFCLVSCVLNTYFYFAHDWDQSIIFSVFSVPAAICIGLLVMKAEGEDGRFVRRRFIAASAILVSSVLTDALINEPFTLFGIPFYGASLSHLLTITAVVILIPVVARSSDEKYEIS